MLREDLIKLSDEELDILDKMLEKLEKEIENDKERGLLYFNKIYQVYTEDCQKKNVMDFEDLLLNNIKLDA